MNGAEEDKHFAEYTNGSAKSSPSEPFCEASQTSFNDRFTARQIEALENEEQLKIEREERRRIQYEAQEEITRETLQTEEIWMEKLKNALEERDLLKQKASHLEEQVNVAKAETHRAAVLRMELEDDKRRLEVQYRSLMRDYDETMLERSQVLEENNCLTEERDRLKQRLSAANSALQAGAQVKTDAQLQQLQGKLEHTRRLLQLNMQDTAAANARRAETLDELSRLKLKVEALSSEKEALCQRLNEVETEKAAIADVWSLHTVDVSIAFPKQNLGVKLDGGRSEYFTTPIYVKDIEPGSVLERSVRKFDQIVFVNEIDVSAMDVRHHLKMVIRRRANMSQVQEVIVTAHPELGLELANGVFVNRVDGGSAADRARLSIGDRVIFVNGVPVADAKHADQLAKSSGGVVRLGVLTGKGAPNSTPAQPAKKSSKSFVSKIKETLTGRPSSKMRGVIASANIGMDSLGDLPYEFFRHGSLRVPTASPRPQPLVRTASLRMLDERQSDRAPNSVLSKRISAVPTPVSASSASRDPPGSTWPKQNPIESGVLRIRHQRPGIPLFNPQQPQHFSPATNCASCSYTSPPPPGRFSTSTLESTPQPASPPHLASSTPRPASRNRVASVFRHSLPDPPPYPGRRNERDMSLSSILSSTNSVPHPSTSSINYQINNSPSETVLSGSSELVRKRGSETSRDRYSAIAGQNSGRDSDHSTNYRRKEDAYDNTEDDVFPIERDHPRFIQAGDLVLEIDSMNVRSATLENATAYLNEGSAEFVDLFVDDGGERLDRIKAGTDGDGFYVRINVDRIGENNDELDIKAGEIVYVDNTLFMGQKGRWRAWKVDREGRQRQCGIIPSECVVDSDRSRLKMRRVHGRQLRPVYERVEKVSATTKRPIMLLGPHTAPFTQLLLDDAPSKYMQCVAECKALSSSEVERMLAAGEIIEARRRDQLYDVISVAALQTQIDLGLHCLVDLSPSAISQLHALRIYPIIIMIKFKNSKQIKELADENGEKVTSKTAKEWFEKALHEEQLLAALDCHPAVVAVSPHHASRTLVKHVCQQIDAQVDHEQKKTLWVASVTHF